MQCIVQIGHRVQRYANHSFALSFDLQRAPTRGSDDGCPMYLASNF